MLVLTQPKLTSQKRISSLVRPDDIDDLFRTLGARPAALAFSEPAIPEAQLYSESPQTVSALIGIRVLTVQLSRRLITGLEVSHICAGPIAGRSGTVLSLLLSLQKTR